MILVIDNYDSFTYNLVHYFQILAEEICVYKHDDITIEEISKLKPNYLVISPGPDGPKEAGISLAAIKYFHKQIPILGICLGHQCLGHAFGATIIPAPTIVHGKTSRIKHQQQGLFRGLPTPFSGTRYHSLAIEPQTLPNCFRVDATCDNTIMAISHRNYPLYGLQFHPEAILTEHGMQLLSNFINHESISNL